jgi:hypothetical protein
MQKLILLLLPVLLGLTSITAQAQANYKPGYVVLTAGDTLRGLIQARGDLRNSRLCRFRPAEDAPTVDYPPAALRAYGLASGLHYDTRLVPLPDSGGQRQERLYFLELLEGGKASLYLRRDGADQTHYYLYMASRGPAPVQELEKRVVHQIIKNQVFNETQNLYRNTLAEAFRDCLAIQPALPTLEFTASSLRSVVRRYNAYSGGTPAVRPAAKKRPALLSGGLVAGVARTKLQFEGQTSLHNGSFTTSASPVGGLYVAAILPDLNENLQLRLDLLYEQLRYADSYVARDFSTVAVQEQASIQLQCLRLPLQLRYCFPIGRVRPFLLGGLTANYLLSSSRQLRSEYTAGNAQVVTNQAAVADANIRRIELGLLGGAGVATPGFGGHAVGLELRAERSTGFVSSGSYSAPLFRYSGLVSISVF